MNERNLSEGFLPKCSSHAKDGKNLRKKKKENRFNHIYFHLRMDFKGLFYSKTKAKTDEISIELL